MWRPDSTGHRQAIGRPSHGTASLAPGSDAFAETATTGLSWPPTAEDLDTVEVVALEPATARAPRARVLAIGGPRHVTVSAPAALIDDDDADALAFASEADVPRPPRRWRLVTARRRARQALLAAAALLLAWPLAEMGRTGLQPELEFAAVPPGLVVPVADLVPAMAGRPEAAPAAPAVSLHPAVSSDTPPRPPLSQRSGPPRQVSGPPAASRPGGYAGPEGRPRVEERVVEAGAAALPPSPAPAVPAAVRTAPPEVAPPAAPPAPRPRPVPAPVPLSASRAADLGEPAARPPTAAVVSDEARIQSTLRRYEAAYGRLDASAAQSVWPSVDARALARAFEGLDSQTLRMERCDVDVRGAVADAACQGSTTYVRRVGSKTPRTEARQWSFRLEKVDEQWQIQTARIR